MADLVFIVLAIGLFALSELYVRACARLTGTARAPVDAANGERS
jgi:hypothetical protein